MWAVVLGDLLFTSRRTTDKVKFLSEMNLQLINIIGGTCTNLADFFPFLTPRKEWTNYNF